MTASVWNPSVPIIDVDPGLRNELASPIGDAIVGHLAPGIGAVPTTVQSEIRRFPSSPEQYGAKGNGVISGGGIVSGTDDTLAIIRWLVAANGAICRPTPGKLYRITANVVELSGVECRIVGESTGWNTAARIPSFGQTWAGFLLDGTNVTLTGFWDTGTNTLTYSTLLKVLKDVVLITNNARYGYVEHLTNALVEGNHFQGFLDHGFVGVGPVFFDMFRNTFYNCGLSKGPSGTFSGGNFINGCGYHITGYALSGVIGNYPSTRVFNSSFFGTTTRMENNWVDSVSTQSSSCKGAIICNLRSLDMSSFGTYSGLYLEYCEVKLDTPHLETYAIGGQTPGDGFPQSLVALNCKIQIKNAFMVYPMLWLRTTPFGVGTDFWQYEIDTNASTEFSRLGFDEFVFGPKLGAFSTVTTRVAALGSVANPIGYYDSVGGALRLSQGNNYNPIVPIPVTIPGTVGAGIFVELVSSQIMPGLEQIPGAGFGGIYDIDVQIGDTGTGRIFYSGTWKGLKQIATGQYQHRFSPMEQNTNNPPAGSFTVTEVLTGGVYVLRITNNTAFPWQYSVTSKVRTIVLQPAI